MLGASVLGKLSRVSRLLCKLYTCNCGRQGHVSSAVCVEQAVSALPVALAALHRWQHVTPTSKYTA
jgi:hypothetical protein